ncbi:MAG: beta-propeller fold lactonase family protein [Ginsengibacter sp.]
MKKIKSLNLVMTAVIVFTLFSCNKNADKSITASTQKGANIEVMINEDGANPDEIAISAKTSLGRSSADASQKHNESSGHFVYTESNAAGTNQIISYRIMGDGTLHYESATGSGGAGTGSGLGSQGAVVIDNNHEWLYAVNAGSNSVSSFKIHSDGSLSLAHTENSHGTTPVSVTVNGDLLYVVNFGSDNIHGFRVGSGGTLSHIDGSTQGLSGTGVAAPQISFTPNGHLLIVTEKATNNISSFKVNGDGSAGPDVVTASTGATPFGFDFARNNLMIVSNAAGGAAGAGSATSYKLRGNGVPDAVNGAVANYEAAPCWVAVTQHGRFAYVTNTASNSVSSYYVAPWGGLYLAHQVAASTDNGPVDIVVAKNNYNVYEVNGKSGTIGEYRRTLLGGLDYIGNVSGLPASVTGLATY